MRAWLRRYRLLLAVLVVLVGAGVALPNINWGGADLRPFRNCTVAYDAINCTYFYQAEPDGTRWVVNPDGMLRKETPDGRTSFIFLWANAKGEVDSWDFSETGAPLQAKPELSLYGPVEYQGPGKIRAALVTNPGNPGTDKPSHSTEAPASNGNDGKFTDCQMWPRGDVLACYYTPQDGWTFQPDGMNEHDGTKSEILKDQDGNHIFLWADASNGVLRAWASKGDPVTGWIKFGPVTRNTTNGQGNHVLAARVY